MQVRVAHVITISSHNAPRHTLNAPSVIEPSSVKIRSQPCVCTTEEESGLRCEAAAASGERGDLHEYHTNINVHARINEEGEGRVDADPSGEAGWNHHSTKHTKPFVSESPEKDRRVRTRCARRCGDVPK